MELLNNKDAMLSYIRASKSKQLKEIAKSLGLSYDVLKGRLEEMGLIGYVTLVCSPEKELQDALPTFHKTRKIIYPYEIDFYNDDLKLGIEFNGIYWHSIEFKSVYEHQEKCNMAWQNGIKLYHIFEHEWTEKNKPVIISHLRRLAHNLRKIDGGEVCQIDKNTAVKFLYDNTIQYKDFDLAFGYFKDGLKAVLTTQGNEITNYAESIDYEVVDGLKSLFSFNQSMYNSSVVYSDFGKYVYDFRELGFKIEEITEPKCYWFKGHVLTDHEVEFYLRGNTSLSNEEYMRKRGFNRFYDCGMLKLVTDSNIVSER